MGINTSDMLFDTIGEYDEEIQVVRDSIRRQFMIGAEHMNNSGGSSRSMKEIDIEQAKEYLQQLRKERGYLDPNFSPEDANIVFFQPGW